MSLIDPGTRWWNRDRVRRGAAVLCWALADVLAFAGTWGGLAGQASPLPLWFSLMGSFLPIPMIVGAMFLFTSGIAEPARADARIIVIPLSAYFIATGLGSLLGGWMSPQGLSGMHAVFVVFVLGGILAIVLAQVLRRRARRAQAVREHVERSGIVTTGVITRARGMSVNYQEVTRVIVRFTDAEGRSRWARARVAGTVQEGRRVRLKYAPEHLGSRAGVVLLG
ncbi:hypothetical protein [Brachybacterium hainanense]|uniref:DUF3592 domain-containing protein n=1 Tax=Brachybacterium hainanense TaxID=1541174 RepID=A0ABV6R7M1_9MICO